MGEGGECVTGGTRLVMLFECVCVCLCFIKSLSYFDRKEILYEKWKLERRSKNDLTEISTENIKNCAFFSICACHSCARRGYVNLRCIVCVFVCLCLFSVSIFFEIFRLDKRTR